MKTIPIIILTLFLAACASGNIITTIKMPDKKEVYEVSSKSDALVSIEKNGVKVTVDNRGRPGFFEQLLGAMFLGASDRKEK
ncbi:hypothetical protein LCGC14_2048950 [marine sediment metagenome]|uniref:Uncharacterized protein n=1 Tax=marine sediment metagenome TaxID=412755 RepID=A0A0F9EPI4_9ZZZZ